LACSHWSIIRW